MSCRLLRDSSPASRLFEAPAPGEQPQSGTLFGTASDDQQPDKSAEEIASLRRRIQDLEAAVPRKTEEARMAGFREGETAGHDRAVADARPVMDRFAAAIAEISELRAKIRHESEHDLVALSLAIARRILRREISVDPDAVHGLVVALFEKLQQRDVTRVRICPGHEEAVRRSFAAARIPPVELTSDPTLSAGDIIVETSTGNLDASVETQLSEIERGFADRLR